MWKIYIDTGGTFTDCLAQGPDGSYSTLKVLSDGSLRSRVVKVEEQRVFLEPFPFSKSPRLEGYSYKIDSESSAFYEITRWIPANRSFQLPKESKISSGDILSIYSGDSAPVLAARMATGSGVEDTLPVEELRLATTLGTNALLERKGARVCLITTKGFEDLLKIGDQSRPRLFELAIPDRETFCAEFIGLKERIDAEGNVLEEPDRHQLDHLISQLNKKDFDSIAVSFLNAYKNPAHEKLVTGYLQAHGFENISTGHIISDAIHFLQRTTTTVVNAYLAPVLEAYKSSIQEKFGKARIFFMQSFGALSPSSDFFPKDSLLSGPAAGVTGAASIADSYGLSSAISFDMGGTSTDTSFISGKPGIVETFDLQDAVLQIPVLDIDTVAAGGGSICSWTNSGFSCGPESASAFPGPACYGQGGPLTLTDIALLTGRIDPAMVNIPLDPEASEKALDKLYKSLKFENRPTRKELVELFIRLAVEHMGSSIDRISTRKGHDAGKSALISFGGAGGMFACDLAEHLGIESIIAPANSGILSALGLSASGLGLSLTMPVYKSLDEIENWRKPVYSKLLSKATSRAKEQGWTPSENVEFNLQCRLKGQRSFIDIPAPEDERDLIGSFHTLYEQLYGYPPPSGVIECVNATIRLRTENESTTQIEPNGKRGRTSEMHRIDAPFSDIEIPVYHWEALDKDLTIEGPALFCNREASVYVRKNWILSLGSGQDLVLHQKPIKEIKSEDSSIENKWSVASLYANRFTQVAEEMGTLLRHTALSANVKERMDFSCAILDHNGYLLVNAPHIPVHLGSMGISLRMLLEEFALDAGDIIIYNDPQYGGSHLPDISLVKAVFDESGTLIGYVANRAHHAEIGGISPGSMPVNAKTIREEGVLIRPFYLSRKGVFNWKGIRDLFENSPYPSRTPELNISDIKAAVAALIKGEQRIVGMARSESGDQIRKTSSYITEMARMAIQQKIKELPTGTLNATEYLDNKAPIKVRIIKAEDRLTFDFKGTANVQEGNMNANVSIVYSVILYALRLWIQEEVPLNDGIMEQVDINLPECMLNPDFSGASPPATAAGNTELSQRLCDTILKALGLAACSQGTMNNVLFGNDSFGYYETVGGGSGAVKGSKGRSGVHTHMTNTKITDIEEMERRFPVRIMNFSCRKGSGGAGQYAGGEGLIRSYLFLDDCTLSFIGQHRIEAPYGLNGGSNGLVGSQKILKLTGGERSLHGIDTAEVMKGDIFVLETPGGGGWGIVN